MATSKTSCRSRLKRYCKPIAPPKALEPVSSSFGKPVRASVSKLMPTFFSMPALLPSTRG